MYISWEESKRAEEITELIELSELSLRDDYFCYEDRCFGTFEISDNREIDFFITRNIAEKVIEQSEKLSTNWGLAKEFCNKVTKSQEKEVCKIGGKTIDQAGNIL